MKRVRINGLVKFANRVRDDLSGGVSVERLERVRRNVAGNIGTVDRILKGHRLGPGYLPGPSRRAYQFLTNIDFDNITTVLRVFRLQGLKVILIIFLMNWAASKMVLIPKRFTALFVRQVKISKV